MSEQTPKARYEAARDIPNPPIVARARATYESFLTNWEWFLRDEEDKPILAPVERILLDINLNTLLVATVFFRIESAEDVEAMQKVKGFVLKAESGSEGIPDNAEFHFIRYAPEAEEEYLLKFGLKVE